MSASAFARVTSGGEYSNTANISRVWRTSVGTYKVTFGLPLEDPDYQVVPLFDEATDPLPYAEIEDRQQSGFTVKWYVNQVLTDTAFTFTAYSGQLTKGDRGEQGIQGKQGVMGERGRIGPRGAAGLDGTDGKDGAGIVTAFTSDDVTTRSFTYAYEFRRTLRSGTFTGIAISSSDQVYLLNTNGDDEVQIYTMSSTNLTYQRAFDVRAATRQRLDDGRGGFTTVYTTVTGMDFDSSGALWTMDERGRLYKYVNRAWVSNAITNPENRVGLARGLAIDSQNNFWISSPSSDTIQKFSSSGASLSSENIDLGAIGINNANSLTLDSSNNFWLTSGSTIYQVSDSGTRLRSYSLNSRNSFASGITLDTTGNIWVSDQTSDYAYKYARTTTTSTSSELTSLTIGGTQRLIPTGTSTGRGPAGPKGDKGDRGATGADGLDAEVTSDNIIRAVRGFPTNNQIIQYDGVTEELEFVDPPTGGGGGGSSSPSSTPVPFIQGDPHYWVSNGDNRTITLVLHDLEITTENSSTNRIVISVAGNPFTVIFPIATASRRISIDLNSNQATNITNNARSGNVGITAELRNGVTPLQNIRGNLPVITEGKAIALKEDIGTGGGGSGTNVVANPSVDSSDPALNSLTVGSTDYRIVGQKGDRGETGAAGRDSTVAGPRGPAGRDGSDATVTSASIVSAVSGTPTDNQIIQYDSSNTRLEFVNLPIPEKGDKGDKGDQGEAGRDSTVPGPAGPAGRDGSDATVTSASIVSAVSGTPTDNQIIQYDSSNTRLEFVNLPIPEKGDKGDKGDQGEAGRDSTVPGPAGPAGRDGSDATVTSASIVSAVSGTPTDNQIIQYDSSNTRLEFVNLPIPEKGDKGDKGDQGEAGRDSTVPGPAGPAGRDGSDATVTSASIVTAVHGTPSDDQIIQYDSSNSRLEFVDPTPQAQGIAYITADPHYWISDSEARIISLVLHDVDIVEANKNVNNLLVDIAGNNFTVNWPIATADRRINIEISAIQATNITNNASGTVRIQVRLRQGQDLVQLVDGSIPTITRSKSIALVEDTGVTIERIISAIGGAPQDEQVLTYESTGPTLQWQTVSSGGTAAAPVGTNQVVVPMTIVGEQSVVSDGSYIVSASTVATGPYATMGTGSDLGKLVFSRNGILRVCVAITCRIAAANGRCNPSIDITGTGVQVVARSNGYYRATSTAKTLYRSVDVVVAKDAIGTLRVINPSHAFSNSTVLLTGLSNIAIFAHGGTTGATGARGAQGLQGLRGLTGSAGAPGRDSTVPGPRGPAGRDGSDATVTSDSIISAVEGNPTDNQIIQYDSSNTRLEFVNLPIPEKGDKGDKGDQGEAGRDSTVPGPAGPAGRDGSDATVTSASIVTAVHGTPSDDQIIQYDSSNSRLEFVDAPSGGGSSITVSRTIALESQGEYTEQSSRRFNFSTASGGTNASGRSVAVDTNGDLLILDTTDDTIYRYRDGSEVPSSRMRFSGVNSSPNAIAIDPTNGDVLNIDNQDDVIYRYKDGREDSSQRITVTAEQTGDDFSPNPNGLTVDYFGTVYATVFGQRKVVVYVNGEFSSELSFELISANADPRGLAIDINGDVLVLDRQDRTVYRYRRGREVGSRRIRLNSGNSNAFDIGVDWTNGDVLVPDLTDRTVYRYSPASYTRSIGEVDVGGTSYEFFRSRIFAGYPPYGTGSGGGTSVAANPSVDSSDPTLNSLTIGNTDYRVVGAKGDKGDRGEQGRSITGPQGPAGSDATVNATNMINAVSGQASAGRVMTWTDRATLTWADQSTDRESHQLITTTFAKTSQTSPRYGEIRTSRSPSLALSVSNITSGSLIEIAETNKVKFLKDAVISLKANIVLVGGSDIGADTGVRSVQLTISGTGITKLWSSDSLYTNPSVRFISFNVGRSIEIQVTKDSIGTLSLSDDTSTTTSLPASFVASITNIVARSL